MWQWYMHGKVPNMLNMPCCLCFHLPYDSHAGCFRIGVRRGV